MLSRCRVAAPKALSQTDGRFPTIRPRRDDPQRFSDKRCRLLKSERTEDRRSAVSIASHLGDRLQPLKSQIELLLKDGDAETRIGAALALSRIDTLATPRSLDVLNAALNHENAAIRKRSVEAMASMKRHANPGVEALDNLSKEDPDPSARDVARIALTAIRPILDRTLDRRASRDALRPSCTQRDVGMTVAKRRPAASPGVEKYSITRLRHELAKSGAEGDRTLNLSIANAALSQLSYRPSKDNILPASPSGRKVAAVGSLALVATFGTLSFLPCRAGRTRGCRRPGSKARPWTSLLRPGGRSRSDRPVAR